jgi:hypothetical protein
MNAPHPVQPPPWTSPEAVLQAVRALKFLAIAFAALALAELAFGVSLLLHLVGATGGCR